MLLIKNFAFQIGIRPASMTMKLNVLFANSPDAKMTATAMRYYGSVANSLFDVLRCLYPFNLILSIIFNII